jgi:hypothetical protein
MAIEIFPVPVTSSINANSITATTSNTMYEGRIAFDSAIYTVTCSSSTIANVQFFSGTTLVTQVTTASGTISLNLASAADRVRLWTDTGSSVVVTITKTASALTNLFSGTLDTITTTSTYTGTSTSGYGYAVLVGGGGGGGSVANSYRRGGGGGGSGSVGGKYLALTGSMAVVIGAAGVAQAAPSSGTSGGTSTFGGMSCPGGAGGVTPPGESQGAGGAGGATPTGADVASAGVNGGTASDGSATTKLYPFVVNGTTGSGGGGFSSRAGGGSGIGTGGSSPYVGAGSSATGYGAGGGGSLNRDEFTAYMGGDGTPGVLYVLRF